MTDQGDDPFSEDVISSLHSHLERLREQNEISPEDCCIVGSVCLSIRGLREHGDIDVCVAPSHRGKIDDVEEPVELAPNKYEHIGVSDETIVYDESFHDVVDGLKIVRPELEYSHKLYRQWDKDRRDIELLDEYRKGTTDWDDELVIDDYTPGVRHVVTRGIRSLRRDGLKKTFEHGLEFARRHGPFRRRKNENYETKPTSVPARAIQSYRQAGLKKTFQRGIRLVQIADPTGLLQRYTNPRHKIKVGTLAEEELKLKYDPADFLAAQYSGEKFTRYDLLVYRRAIEEHRGDSEGGFDLYEAFHKDANIRPLDEFLDRVDQYFDRQAQLPVPIGYSSQILDPEIAACALYDQSADIEVVVGNSSGDPKQYPISWFETNGFSEKKINELRSEFSTLLDDTGLLFEVIIWPPAYDYFEEILETLTEEETVHSCKQLTFDRETFADFVFDLYATQDDVRWEYIERKVEQISEPRSNILSIQIEVPNPRIRESNSHEMKEIKERYRTRYNPQIAPDDPNTRRTIHAADNYHHNRQTKAVLEEYEEKATRTNDLIPLGKRHTVDVPEIEVSKSVTVEYRDSVE